MLLPRFAEIQQILNTNAEVIEKLPPMNISVLRNVTLEPLEPYLRYYAYQCGYNARVLYGGYDTIYQEAVGGNKSLLNETTNVVFVFYKLENLSWILARNYVSLSEKDVQEELSTLKENISRVIQGIRLQTPAMILWHSFEKPLYPALGIWDSQTPLGQIEAINNLNMFLRDSLAKIPGAYLVDLDLCLGRLGFERFYDSRYWHINRAPFTREALAEIASEDFKYIRALKGKNKKCLVLDCDNTLWGGIVGEDGISGLKLGTTYPGSVFYEFQQEVLNLYHRGVILALCSKNNEEDVWNVFRSHPYMLVREEHISAAQINWRDKVANIKQIALDLNIGLDSLVFVDDSEFELHLIKELLPEVEILHNPTSGNTNFRERFMACGLFDTLTITEEDKQRGNMYRAQTIRSKLLAEATNLDDYFESLEMVVEITVANEFTIPRITQLTQKTNQFNLTTNRYSEADIKAIVENPSADAISLRLMDRYGDLGIVGVCILFYEGDEALIDTFLLSCRALGRKVEDILLNQALWLAKLHGCIKVTGKYVPTNKNHQVKDYYSNHGFNEISSTDNNLIFAIELMELQKHYPSYFKAIHSDIDQFMEIK
jgi:FkbH-like protein